MPRTRHAVAAERLLVRSLALGLPHGYRTDLHSHPWAQLVLARSGVLTVSTEQGIWVVPPERAVWVPEGMEHRLAATGEVALRTLYLREDVARPLVRDCCVVPVSPLVRELALEVVRLGALRDDDAAHVRLAGVLVDQLTVAREAPLELSMPTDPRARAVAERVRARPASRATLAQLAAGSGAAPRTQERLFRRETGLTFDQWRRRARLLAALERLAAGVPVTTVALDVGYDSSSAFIAMFRNALGTTPGRWMQGERSAPDG